MGDPDAAEHEKKCHQQLPKFSNENLIRRRTLHSQVALGRSGIPPSRLFHLSISSSLGESSEFDERLLHFLHGDVLGMALVRITEASLRIWLKAFFPHHVTAIRPHGTVCRSRIA
ncbi:hypothetical protein GcC1_034026 [Golovinomyces cichoracearum]|uniref:Uncharacterized protein n=1 Tax=Golovinomyces cichoracearum TaxID=62708 RepID=A0A420J1E9_9PEZI|nr:hypothetical protein GcC1_034026 [Golovinomyces cichoracearum]